MTLDQEIQVRFLARQPLQWSFNGQDIALIRQRFVGSTPSHCTRGYSLAVGRLLAMQIARVQIPLLALGPRGEMDITSDFGSDVVSSSLAEGAILWDRLIRKALAPLMQ